MAILKQAQETQGICLETLREDVLNEQYLRAVMPNGLRLFMAPNARYSTAHALFATCYGSMDDTLPTKEEPLPDGIAHFLEHKMFEDEDGDAFVRFSATGSNANAYTTFDRTVYLFSGSNTAGQFAKSLEILLDFVQRPYFTEQSVAKEQGIIGQEIQMYQDSADWMVFFQLIQALYAQNGVRKDTVGSIESIAQITPQLLYDCYHTYYQPGNMALILAGNFHPDEALAICEKLCQAPKGEPLPPRPMAEPKEVVKRFVCDTMPVSRPMFAVGFKLDPKEHYSLTQHYVNCSIACGCLFGDTSAVYQSLYDQGLINPEFDDSSFQETGVLAMICEGESDDPKQVAEALSGAVAKALKEGLDADVFEGVRRAFLGKLIRSFQNPGQVASSLLDAAFYETDPFTVYQAAADLTLAQLQAWLCDVMDAENWALSVIEPQKEATA